MSDQPRENPPDASVRTGRHRRYSLIWLIPIVTALIGGYLIFDTLSSEGPTVRITFQNAEGLAAGKSPVKHKDVDMGTVRKIALSPDLDHVIVTLEMKPSAAPLLTDQTQFWVVKPRIFAGAISGLQTLLSGSYVAMHPGPARSHGKVKHDFTGLENPPVLTSDTPGRTVLVKAKRIGSIGLGSPVFFRDLEVGQVLGYDVADMARTVTVHVFVKAPFDKYLHDNSRFWNASGLTASLGDKGLNVEVQSLKAVLLGGIAFNTPPGGQPLGSKDNEEFTLYLDKGDADAASYGQQVKFVAYFDASVRGLAVGADVDLYGLKIGQVTDVGLKYDPVQDKVLVPVEFEVQPGRIAQSELDPRSKPYDAVASLVARGMRARLVSANIITGAQLVSLDIIPGAAPATLGRQGDTLVIPTVSGGGIDNIAATASKLLSQIGAIPFEEIGRHLNDALAGVDRATGGTKLADAVTALDSALASVRDVAGNLNRGLTPALKKLPAISDGLTQSVERLNAVLATVKAGYGDDSRFHQGLEDTLTQLKDTARSIQALSDLLTRHPEALIRGRTGSGRE